MWAGITAGFYISYELNRVLCAFSFFFVVKIVLYNLPPRQSSPLDNDSSWVLPRQAVDHCPNTLTSFLPNSLKEGEKV